MCVHGMASLNRNAINPAYVIVGTIIGLTVSAIPFMSKNVREREHAVHRMRDESYDAKEQARSERLSRNPVREESR